MRDNGGHDVAFLFPSQSILPPPTLAILALIVLAMPPYDGKPDRYMGAAVFVLFPWLLHTLDVLFGFGRGRAGGNPGDTGGASFGDGGCGGGGGGGGE